MDPSPCERRNRDYTNPSTESDNSRYARFKSERQARELQRESQNVIPTRRPFLGPLAQCYANTRLFPSPGNSIAQPTTTLPLPEVSNLTGLMNGAHDDSTRLVNNKKYHASRFASASQTSENTNRVSLPDRDPAKPKYDEKKLLASIRALENTVAELKHQRAESEHTIQFLRQKAFEAESKEMRRDSALGSFSGGSNEEEDQSDASLRIEKKRHNARIKVLRNICHTHDELIDHLTQERDKAVSERDQAILERDKAISERDRAVSEREKAVSQARKARATHDELKIQAEGATKANHRMHERMAEENARERDQYDVIKEQLKSVEADPKITAQLDQIMRSEKEEIDMSHARIDADRRALQKEVYPPIPALSPFAFSIRDDNSERQPDASAHQEPKVTIHDVSIPLSYQSNIAGSTTDLRKNFEGSKANGDLSRMSVDEDNSIVSPKQQVSPRQKVSPKQPQNPSLPRTPRQAQFYDQSSDVWMNDVVTEAPTQPAKAIPVRRRVTPFPMLSVVKRKDNSQSTVENALDQSRTTPTSLLDNNRSTAEHVTTKSREAHGSLLGDDAKSAQNESSYIAPTQPSLLGHDANAGIDQNRPIRRSLIDGSELTFGQSPKNQRSLLDEDPQSASGRNFIAPRVECSQPVEKGNLSKTAESATPCLIDYSQPDQKEELAQPSLLDCNNKPVVGGSNVNQKAKRTKVIRKPIAVSDRMPVPGPYEEEPTIRPSQHPGIALATVLGALESELSELKGSARKYQSLYDNHDAALSKRSRKCVFERLQKLNQTIDAKADQIYSLYDVLEGQKESGQEMSQAEVEVTLHSIGIDPEEITWNGTEFTGTHSTSSSRRA